MLITIILITLLILLPYSYHKKFGKHPRGERLKRVQKSTNYKNGQFQNLTPTPMFAEGVTWRKMITDSLFSKSKNSKPKHRIPSTKIDIHSLDLKLNCLIWLGHSSYFLQLDGKRFLIDPVLNGNASPFKIAIRNFRGSNPYTVNDFPEIDFLLITHDHWDHIDYKSLRKLRLKIKKVITGLGTGEHFEYWGFNPEIIIEKDWYESEIIESGFEIIATPARHFSGRFFKRNQALWVSFVLKTPSFKIFINGDSGRDSHYKAIGEKYGPFDLALMECGQYNYKWPNIHHAPEEVIESVIDLKAKLFLPGHWSKFDLAKHPWDEPIIRVISEAEKHKTPYLTPIIGDVVNLNEQIVPLKWWNNIHK